MTLKRRISLRVLAVAWAVSVFWSVCAAGIPVLYIDTDGGAAIQSKEEYIPAKMRLVDGGATAYEGSIQVKGRGNTTWRRPKKPYKIKLDKKADFFGFGKNKHWVLLANYLDESLMRNKVAYDLSGQLGLTYMKSTWVDLVLNGNPVGVYQFCEHVRVGKTRVDVFDWEEASEARGGVAEDLSWVDGDPSLDVSGGYLFELSEEFDEITRFETAGGLHVMAKAPEYLGTSLRMGEYVRDLWRRFETAFMAPGKTNAQDERFTDIADLDSMVAYWLTQEIVGNNDGVYKSRFCWKDQGGKLNFGPVWDCDWGCGSAPVGYYPAGWKVTDAGNPRSFYSYWVESPEFVERAWKMYWANHDYILSIARNGGLIDQYTDLLRSSAARNEAKWRYRRGFSGPSGDAAVFKSYMAERVAWLDRCFKTVSSLRESLRGTLPQRDFGLTKARQVLYGTVSQNGVLAGNLRLNIAKPARKGVRVSGALYRLDGKFVSLPGVTVPPGGVPAVYEKDVRLWGTVSLDLYDRMFEGAVGEAYEVQKIGSLLPVGRDRLTFRLSGAVDLGNGLAVQEDRLPRDVPLEFLRTRIRTVRGEPNESSLKLSVNKNSGVFKGTFYVYATGGNSPRPQKFRFKIAGLFADGIGRGTCSCDRLPGCRLGVTIH